MQKTLAALWWSVFFLFLASYTVACGSACEDLADKICSCMPTRSQKESCKIAISAAKKNVDVSSSEEDTCQRIIDSGSCTCAAVAADDWSACGLANNP